MNSHPRPFPDLLTTTRAIASGATSAQAVTRAFLDTIHATEDRCRAFVTVLDESALAQAGQRDAELAAGMYRGPLHGIPVAVKDLVSIKNLPTSSGGIALHDRLPNEDATLVRRLTDAGAIVIGKTKLAEGAGTSHHPTVQPPLNPWHPGRCAGFSSSGSGVAIMADLCLAAIGSDTGGSIRIPAALTGVTGLKPSWGRVSRHGVFPLVEYLDTLGPLTRTAADAAVVMAAIAGPDPLDPTTWPEPAPNYLATIDNGIAGKTIGYDRDLLAGCCDDQVLAGIEEAAAILRSLGAHIVPISLPMPDAGHIGTYVAAGMAEAHRDIFPARQADYGPDLAHIIERSRHAPGIDVAAGINAANLFRGQIQHLMRRVDMLLVPALTTLAPETGALERAIGEGNDLNALRFMLMFNISGNPAIVLPAGFDRDGLPLSIQLVGRMYDESLLLQAGHAFQRVTDWHTRRPPPIA